jgi:chemosensory pili system protein ChpC
MSALPEVLRVLLLPSDGAELMLPAAAVAEIVRAERLDPPAEGGPDWLAGTLPWRGLSVPVVRLVQGHDARRRHAVVCFAPSARGHLPFFAVESPGLPQLAKIGADVLAPEAEPQDNPPPFVLTDLRLNDRPVWLMDLDALERSLLA